MSQQEPLIVSFGREHVKDYKPKEYKDSLVKAFRDNEADYITLDSNMNGQKFRAACVSWAIDKGLLKVDRISEEDEQCSVYSFRLTTKGKKEILD